MWQCPQIVLSDHLPRSACNFLGRPEFGEATEMNPSCVLCTGSLLGDRQWPPLLCHIWFPRRSIMWPRPHDLQTQARLPSLFFLVLHQGQCCSSCYMMLVLLLAGRHLFVSVPLVGSTDCTLVVWTTTSPFMTSQQFRILAALCTCADHVPQLEPSSVSMFSFERSIIKFLDLGGSLASKKQFAQ